jgi:hypothetical protein
MSIRLTDESVAIARRAVERYERQHPPLRSNAPRAGDALYDDRAPLPEFDPKVVYLLLGFFTLIGLGLGFSLGIWAVGGTLWH